MAKRKFAIGEFELVVRRSRTGRGLFTVDPIERGRCIVEYTGRVLSEAEEYTSRWCSPSIRQPGRVLSEAEEYTSNSKYLFAVNKRKTIDGREKTNIARYVNHSCRPNCEIEIWRGRIYVMAKRAIKPGEELFYDYDTEYFNEHIRPKGCKCSPDWEMSGFPFTALAAARRLLACSKEAERDFRQADTQEGAHRLCRENREIAGASSSEGSCGQGSGRQARWGKG